MSTNEDLLEFIPPESLEARPIVPEANRQSTWPTYKMRGTLQRVRDLYQSESDTPIVINQENGTRIHLWHRSYTLNVQRGEHLLKLEWEQGHGMDVRCKILGPSKEALLETSTMLCNLLSRDLKSFDIFSCDVLTPDHLFRWLQANCSTARVEFRLMISTHEESLHIRRDSTGYIAFHRGSTLDTYLEAIPRLPNVQEVWFNYIKFRLPLEMTLRALSTPVHAIGLRIDEKDLQGEDFRSANIVAKDIKLVIGSRCFFPGQLIASLLRRMGKSGQLENVNFTICQDMLPPGIVDTRIAEELVTELVRLIESNQNLKSLRLSCLTYMNNWDGHIERVVDALKRNKGLCHVNVDEDPFDEKPVRISPEIDQRFLTFNRFFRLAQEPQAIRQSLVVQALNSSTRNNFGRNASLLKHHTDTLCELLQETTFVPDQSLNSTSIPAIAPGKPTSSKKRQVIRIQPARAAKKRASSVAISTRKQPARAVKKRLKR